MGIWAWLFGSSSAAHSQVKSASRWQKSEQGNATITTGNRRLTVFSHDGGYKFCVAKADRDDRNPYFSDVYASHADAMSAGKAYIDGRPSPIISQTSQWRDERRSRSRLYLQETAGRLKDLSGQIAQARNITDLRRIERKAESTAKAMSNQLGRALHDDLSIEDIERAERLKQTAEDLLKHVQETIRIKKGERT